MHLDLEDYRPDTPRVPQAMSLREGTLISLLIHAVLLILYLLAPEAGPVPDSALALQRPPQESPRFVHMVPRIDRQAVPRLETEQSDLDRRAATTQRPADARNAAPFSVGDTPEKVVGGREEKPAGPDLPSPPSPANASAPDVISKLSPSAAPAAPAPPPGGSLGRSLRNLSRYLQDQNFDNQQGGLADNGPDIQFDSKGVDFGPWLRRFVAQVKRNWYVPQSAMMLSGRVVIQFNVLRNGTITDLKVVGPSSIEAYNTSSLNALKLSNPTLELPAEYPDDRAFFTVTFHYDVRLAN